MPRNHPLQRTSQQPDRYPPTRAESHQQQEKGFPRHPFPKRAEKPGEVVAEKARKKQENA